MDILRALMLVLAIAATLNVGNSSSASAETPSPATRFDFWIGNWELSSAGKAAGTNTITREYDGAVIMERFVGTGDSQLEGMSVSVFNKNTGKWHQTWVDNQGSYLDFTGGFADGRMILSRKATIQGKEALQRMVWFNITPDSFDWHWERSDDDGATWNVLWPLHYERKKQ